MQNAHRTGIVIMHNFLDQINDAGSENEQIKFMSALLDQITNDDFNVDRADVDDLIDLVDAWLQMAIAFEKVSAKHPPSTPDHSWKATHRHVKRGSHYMHLATAKMQTSGHIEDMQSVEVYQAEDGEWWVRPSHEFNDGRFEEI